MKQSTIVETRQTRKHQPSPADAYLRVQTATLIYMPVFAFFNTIGFLTLYYLSTIDLITEGGSQFLGIAFASGLLGITYLIASWGVKGKSLRVIDLLTPALTPLFFLSMTLFMENILVLLILFAWLVPVIQLIVRASRNRLVISGIFSLLASIAIFWLDLNPPFERIASGSIASLASMVLFGAIVTMVIVLAVFMEVIQFRTISARLVTTFAFITIVPAMATSLIVALVNFEHDRSIQFTILETVTSLKEKQISSLLNDSEADAVNTIFDPDIYSRAVFITQSVQRNQFYDLNYEIINRFYQQEKAKKRDIEEILLLDRNGVCVYSTIKENLGTDYSDSRYLPIGMKSFTGILNWDSATNKPSVVIGIPLASMDGTVAGLFIERRSFDAYRKIMEGTIGFGQSAETYLVSNEYKALTKTLSPTEYVQTDAASSAIRFGIERGFSEGSGTYNNYDNQRVLGYFRWIPRIQTALIAEIKEDAVLGEVYGIFISNGVIGGLGIIVAMIAVVLTARSIAAPISSLNETSRRFAGGDLTSRASITSNDEIGTLANAFNDMAGRLQESIEDLEKKIEVRTRDIERQTARLRAAAEVARDATISTNLDDLLNRSAQLILDRFGFYHAGIFLLDSLKEYALLRASPTPAGQQMIANRHQLKVGETGLVGYSAATGLPRIALDTGLDAVHFENPLLPATRSEMALPLKVGDNIIGVLDVQSDQPEAFNRDDIDTLQIMADQLAVAIERTRLLQSTEQNVIELQRATQQFTERSWQSFGKTLETRGYKYEGITILPLGDLSPESRSVLEKGEPLIVSERSKNAVLVMPVKLRGQTIGALTLRFNQSQVSQETISLIEEVSSRLAQALETSRLLIESQKRADREKAISTASARIGESINVDAVLRSAAEELGRLIHDSEITIQIQND